MASLAMMTSILGNASCIANRAATNRRRNVVVAKQQTNAEEKVGSRRAIVLGVAAAAVAAVGSIERNAVAKEEPKPGSQEAKKQYAPVCVTMPTAKICRN